MTDKNSLPKIMSAAGKTERLVFARLSRGCDFVESLEEICKKHNIRGGCLVSCIGGFEEMVLHIPPQRGQSGGFGPPDRVLGSMQLESCQGIIGMSENGEPHVHLHVTIFCNDENRMYGGHLRKGENKVGTTLELVIAPVEGMDVSFKMFPEIDAAEPTLCPETPQ